VFETSWEFVGSGGYATVRTALSLRTLPGEALVETAIAGHTGCQIESAHRHLAASLGGRRVGEQPLERRRRFLELLRGRVVEHHADATVSHQLAGIADAVVDDDGNAAAEEFRELRRRRCALREADADEKDADVHQAHQRGHLVERRARQHEPIRGQPRARRIGAEPAVIFARHEQRFHPIEAPREKGEVQQRLVAQVPVAQRSDVPRDEGAVEP